MSEGRRKRAVLVTVEITEDGSLISLDDAVQTDHDGNWRKAEHVTTRRLLGTSWSFRTVS